MGNHWLELLNPPTGEIDLDTVPCTKALKKGLKSVPRRDDDGRRLRASRMFSLCPRQYMLNFVEPRAEGTGHWRSPIQMGMGTWWHRFLQDTVLGPMGVLWGRWRRGKIFSREGFCPEGRGWTFVEAHLEDRRGITGRCDGLIDLARFDAYLNDRDMPDSDPEKLDLLEIKTTGTYIFDNLVTPPDYYVCQASLYMDMLGKERSVFLYVNVEDRNYPIKWVVVRKNEKLLADCYQKVAAIERHFQRGVLIDQRACLSPTEKRAKACPFQRECWSTSFDLRDYTVQAIAHAPETSHGKPVKSKLEEFLNAMA